MTLLVSAGIVFLLAHSALTPRALARYAALISLTIPKAFRGWLAIFSQVIHPEAPLSTQLRFFASFARSVLRVAYFDYSVVRRGAVRLFTGARRTWCNRGARSYYLIFAAGHAAADPRRS